MVFDLLKVLKCMYTCTHRGLSYFRVNIAGWTSSGLANVLWFGQIHAYIILVQYFYSCFLLDPEVNEKDLMKLRFKTSTFLIKLSWACVCVLTWETVTTVTCKSQEPKTGINHLYTGVLTRPLNTHIKTSRQGLQAMETAIIILCTYSVGYRENFIHK